LSIGEKGQSSGCALRHASRPLFTVDALDAEAAFPHRVLCGTELGHMKRTGLDAVPASDAHASNMLHNAVFSSLQSSCRASRDTRWIIAVEAGRRNGERVAGREFSGNMSPDAAKLHARRRVVFQLAAYLAGVAANTFFCVKNDQRFHSIKP
jgi:hypothetical protein